VDESWRRRKVSTLMADTEFSLECFHGVNPEVANASTETKQSRCGERRGNTMASPKRSQHNRVVEGVFRLRAVVLALGESAQPPWWRTAFLNETGLRFLERLYPRTAFHAAVHAAGHAACDVHDQAIGRRGVCC